MRQRGGKRPGAGRKPIAPGQKKKPVTVWLTPAEREHCAKLVGTNAQAGIRHLIKESRTMAVPDGHWSWRKEKVN